MRNQNTHTQTHMKLIINKDVEQVIHVFAVFKTVCNKSGSELTRCHDH